MRPNRKHWPALVGAVVLATALLAPGAFGLNHEQDPPPGGNDPTNTNDTSSPPSSSGDRLSVSGGSVDGRYISFDVDATTGTVCDWAFDGLVVIDEIRWDNFSAEMKHAGSVVVLRDMGGPASLMDDNATPSNTTPSAGDATGNGTSDDSPEGNTTGNGTASDDTTAGNGTTDDTTGNGTAASNACADIPSDTGQASNESDASASGAGSRVVLHDNPIGSIKLEARGPETVEIVVADNLTAQASGDRVTVTGDGFEARLWKDQDGNESGFEVDGQVIRFTSVDKGNLMWRVVDADREGDAQVADAQEQGIVCAEVVVLPDEDIVAEAGDDDLVVISTQRSDTHINISVDIDPTFVDTADEEVTPEPVAPAPPAEPDNGTDNGTVNQTGNGTTPPDNGTGNGTGTAPPAAPVTVVEPISVLVIDLDVSVYAAIAEGDLNVTIDGVPVTLATSVDEVIQLGDERLVWVSGDGNQTRIVASVGEGTQVLSVESKTAAFTAESTPLFGDDADGEALESGDGEDDDGQVEVDTPAAPLALLVVGLMAAAAVAVRRKL